MGAHLAPEEPEEDPLVLGVFKPKDGVREKLRETLHNVLAVEMAERAKEVQFEEAEGVTSVPNAVTISKNTRYAAQEVVLWDINTHAQSWRNKSTFTFEQYFAIFSPFSSFHTCLMKVRPP